MFATSGLGKLRGKEELSTLDRNQAVIAQQVVHRRGKCIMNERWVHSLQRYCVRNIVALTPWRGLIDPSSFIIE